MAKNSVNKRSMSGYEIQRIILVVLLVGLVVSAIIFGYQSGRQTGEVTNDGPIIYEESQASQEGAE
jgi:hypothetical protein